MSKILYFLAGAPGIPPTSAETAEIAVINAIANQQYEVNVMCGGSRASITGINLSAVASDNSYNDAGSTITGTGISASATDNSLNDTGNGFVTAGFKAGDVLTISGFSGAGDPDNNTTGEAVVHSVAAGKIVLSGVTLVSDDAGEAVTVLTGGRFLQRGFAKGMKVMVRGFTEHAENNIDSGIITALTATKMTIGGSDGDVILNDAAGEAVTICSVETGILAGDSVIAADYIAGTVPEQYKTSGTPIYTVFDPTSPPDSPGLAGTQAIISNNEAVNVKNSALTTTDPATAVVASHACYVKLPSNQTVVESADTVNVGSDAVTLTVTAGVLASGSIGGTKTIVEAADTLALTTAGTVTFGVSGGTLTGDIASGTAVVANSASTTVSTKPITLAVSGRTLGVATLTNTTDAAISSGATVAVDGATCTLTVTGNALASGTLGTTGATAKVVKHGDTATASGSGTTATFTVIDGVVTVALT